MSTKYKPNDVQRIRLQNQLDFFIHQSYKPIDAAFYIASLAVRLNVETEIDPAKDIDLQKDMRILFEELGYAVHGDWHTGEVRKIETEGK